MVAGGIGLGHVPSLTYFASGGQCGKKKLLGSLSRTPDMLGTELSAGSEGGRIFLRYGGGGSRVQVMVLEA